MAVSLSPESQEKIQQLFTRYPTKRAALIPALHLASKEFLVLTDEVCQAIADLLEVPMVDVKGVATFYTMFPVQPRGKYYLQVCASLSCSLNGARHRIHHLENVLGIKAGETTPGPHL